MGLREVLRERTGRMGGSAQVDCGELGVLTVEALSPSDCARLSGDSRSLLYAACRELQLAGEALRSEGKIFRPDEVAAYLTDGEADKAARTILELSGLSGDGGSAEGPLVYTHTQSAYTMEPGRTEAVRHESVQQDLTEIRPQSVQTPDSPLAGDGGLWAGEEEIRLLSVQGSGAPAAENGQVSREFFPQEGNFARESGERQKSQILGDSSGRPAQILVAGQGEMPQGGFSMTDADSGLHETESEMQRQGRGHLHETESEFRKNRRLDLHEITSDSGGRRGILLHETESEYEWILHEVESELKNAVHEIKSEVRKMLHETKSELAEEAAQRLAEALLRAGQVR